MPTIDGKTKVTLGAALVVFVAVLGFVWKMSSMWTLGTMTVEAQAAEVRHIKALLERSVTEQTERNELLETAVEQNSHNIEQLMQQMLAGRRWSYEMEAAKYDIEARLGEPVNPRDVYRMFYPQSEEGNP